MLGIRCVVLTEICTVNASAKPPDKITNHILIKKLQVIARDLQHHAIGMVGSETVDGDNDH